jgi:Arc/MetJ family transcription regulator
MEAPMSRTNIDIDDELMAATMKLSGKATKKAAVEEAMRQYTRSMIMRDLIEGMRGMAWNDGLGDDHNEFAEDEVLFRGGE